MLYNILLKAICKEMTSKITQKGSQAMETIL